MKVHEEDNTTFYSVSGFGCVIGYVTIQCPIIIEIGKGQVSGIPNGGKKTVFIQTSEL